jgi:hypothetical protein
VKHLRVHVISQVFGYWLNQVTKNFFLYKTQPHCVCLVRKIDLFSVSLGLKTVVLSETGNRNSGRFEIRSYKEKVFFFIVLLFESCSKYIFKGSLKYEYIANGK